MFFVVPRVTAAVAAGGLLIAGLAQAQDGVRIGVLNDQSGVFATYQGRLRIQVGSTEGCCDNFRRRRIPAGERRELSAVELDARSCLIAG
jgi:hypothetical protein